MDNLEAQTTLGTQYRTKTNKTKSTAHNTKKRSKL